MALGREANGNNLGKSLRFPHNNGIMSTHNIQFYDRIRKIP